jgi:2,4-didehydro-3-deoxy-L-rhamnonate hydrolase
MTTRLIHYRHHQANRWGVVFGSAIAPLSRDFATTADLVTHGLDEASALTPASATVPLHTVALLPPVTANQQFICQGINYASHVRESGMDPAQISFNTIFTKAPSSICAADADIVKPADVALLDHEIELGLVLKRSVTGPVTLGMHELHDWFAGVTIVNDVTARDVQLPQGQFYKGKSYRGFGPVGPYLVLLDRAEWLRVLDLHMRLDVNGQPRQTAHCREMLYRPDQTLMELSRLQDLSAGDLIATGTPAGCAARAPSKLKMLLARLLMSERTKWQAFVRHGRREPRYLKGGDTLTLSIRTDDGAIDLGEQRCRVVASSHTVLATTT